MAIQREDGLLMNPLLSKGQIGEGANSEGFAARLWEEKKKLWLVAGPAIFTRVSTFGVSVISLAFIGHIGSTELAAFALVFTVIVRFGNGILLGMASALETLCGQSFGAGQHHMLGIYLQRSWLVLLPFTGTLMPLFLFTTPLLRLLGQDEAVALMAGKISLWFIPAVFSYGLSYTLQMYLQSQSKNRVITYYAALSLSVHLIVSWFLTAKLGLGLAGVMSSAIIAFWIPVVGQLLFVFCGGCPETWKGFSSEAFKNLWAFYKLSFSSGVMLCLELWYITILILLTGHMTDAEVAIDALSICININGWELMITLGLLAGVGVRVANELGAGSADRVKFSIIVAAATSSAIGFVLFFSFLLLRGQISYIFTDSVLVSEAVADLSPVLAVSILLNSVQPILTGVAIGAGWQGAIAYVNIACYYLVGVPFGFLLGYVYSLGVKGVWIGMISGVAAQTLVLIFMTYRTDWDHEISLTRSRLERWSMRKLDEDGAIERA